MSDLQTNLVLLGAVLIVVIFALTRIQEYRYRRMANQLLPENSQDALMGEANDGLPHEPGLGSDPDLGSDPKSAKSGNSRLSRARFSCSLLSVGMGLVSLS
jgi:hypothetical protein